MFKESWILASTGALFNLESDALLEPSAKKAVPPKVVELSVPISIAMIEEANLFARIIIPWVVLVAIWCLVKLTKCWAVTPLAVKKLLADPPLKLVLLTVDLALLVTSTVNSGTTH